MSKLTRKLNRITIPRVINTIVNKIETKLKTTKCLSMPTDLDIVLTKRCNADCVFCIKYKTHGITEMTLENFTSIAKNLFPYCLRVRFCSGGDPFLNKNIKKFLDICQKYMVRVTITTNGTYLDESTCKYLVRYPNLEEINISLDGSNKDTVESIRKNVNYEKIFENIKNLCKERDLIQNKNLSINIRFAALKSNIKELPKTIINAKKLGVDKVCVNYLYATKVINPKESLFFYKKIAQKYFNLAKKEATKQNIKLELPPKIGVKTNPINCTLPWKFAFIDSDSSIRMCYRSLDYKQGNFSDKKSFLKEWNNQYFKNIRKTINTSKPSFNHCNICSDRIGYNKKTAHIAE